MKKLSLLVVAFMACILQVNAQDFVSTEPANRNVVIEEFTGRSCVYCPDGHVVANQIVHNNPGRAWAVNVHAGGFSPTSFPNLNTTVSTTIHNGFGISGYPTGVVNRSTYEGQSRGAWANLANQQLGQAAECNVAGQAVVNPVTRLATITVEVYYTANSAESSNYLTVVMLQDSIWGSQTGGSSNPEQWVNGQYCHMHILRDAVTPTWGEEISPTTAGTLVTRTYTYQIPEMIGDPNGVEVDIDNIAFLAYVTEGVKMPGNATRPMLNANELNILQGVDQAIYPVITAAAQESAISCSHKKSFVLNVTNGGLDELTSINFEAEMNGDIVEYEWTGSLPQYGSTIITMDMDVPFGTHQVEFRITEANGQAFEFVRQATATCDEWVEAEVDGAEEELTIDIMQDKYGNQITWQLLGSDMSVIAEGGPYTMLQGGSGTLMNRETVVVPANECLQFVITDNVGNGICCNYGEGYYQIYDSKDNIIIDGDGNFGSGATHTISIIGENVATECQTLEATEIGFYSAVLNGVVTSGNPTEVGFEYKLQDAEEWNSVEAEENGNEFSYELTDLTTNATYVYRAYAVAYSGEVVYAEEMSFTTNYDDVNELAAASYEIYPNPVKNTLTIKGDMMNQVMIYNSVGQLVRTINCDTDNLVVDVNALQNGVYFISIMNNNGEVSTNRVSVMH